MTVATEIIYLARAPLRAGEVRGMLWTTKHLRLATSLLTGQARLETPMPLRSIEGFVPVCLHGLSVRRDN